jgi:hypothetical protein
MKDKELITDLIESLERTIILLDDNREIKDVGNTINGRNQAKELNELLVSLKLEQ